MLRVESGLSSKDGLFHLSNAFKIGLLMHNRHAIKLQHVRTFVAIADGRRRHLARRTPAQPSRQPAASRQIRALGARARRVSSSTGSGAASGSRRRARTSLQRSRRLLADARVAPASAPAPSRPASTGDAAGSAPRRRSIETRAESPSSRAIGGATPASTSASSRTAAPRLPSAAGARRQSIWRLMPAGDERFHGRLLAPDASPRRRYRATHRLAAAAPRSTSPSWPTSRCCCCAANLPRAPGSRRPATSRISGRARCWRAPHPTP